MGDSDSDDSESEGGLGNVSRVVMRPPGHSGKAKKGHLCFDAAFETGNLGRVDLVNEYEYDLFIRPDTCNPRFRIWFHFTVDNIRLDQRVIFNIVNISKKKNHLLDGMTPIVRSTTRPKWQRLPNQVVFYYRSPEHRNHYVLSFTFAFDREEEIYHFALCRPYSYSRCQAHLEQLDRKGFPHVRREVLSLSLQQRRLDVLTITAPPNMDAPLNQRVVVILARVHPGETPASFICQGLIDFLVGSHPIAVLLRDHVIFKVVPMMNPDGVFLGNQKCSLLGLDLNRGWIDATPLSHPTLDAVQNLLAELNQRKDVHLDFVFDIHAHTSLHGAFIYGNSYDDVYRYERHIVYPKLLAQNAEDFNSLDTMYNRDPKKAGTARRYLCATLKDSVNCYTLFASLHGYRRDSPPYFLNYSEEGYFRLGRNVARTYLDYYHVVGVIPLGLPMSPGTLKRAGRRSRPRHRRRSRSWPSREPRRRTPGGRRAVPLRPHQVQCYCVMTSSSDEDDEEAEAYFLAGRPFPPPRALQRASSPARALQRSPPRASRTARNLSPPGGPRTRRKVGGGGIISSAWCPPPAPPPAPPPGPAWDGGIPRGPHPTPGGESPQPLLSIIDFNQLARGGLEAAASGAGGGAGGGTGGGAGGVGAASSCPRIRVRTARDRTQRRLVAESSAAG